MGDGISILTSVSKVGTVSRAVASQQTHAQAQEEAAKRAQQPNEAESVLLKNVEATERTRVGDNEEKRHKRRREAKRRKKKQGGGPERGGTIDLKV